MTVRKLKVQVENIAGARLAQQLLAIGGLEVRRARSRAPNLCRSGTTTRPSRCEFFATVDRRSKVGSEPEEVRRFLHVFNVGATSRTQ